MAGESMEVKSKDLFALLLGKIKQFDSDLKGVKEIAKHWDKINKEIKSIKETLDTTEDTTEAVEKLKEHVEKLNTWKDQMDDIDLKKIVRSVNAQNREINVIKKHMKEIKENPVDKKGSGGPMLVSGIGTIAGIAGAIMIEYLTTRGGG